MIPVRLIPFALAVLWGFNWPAVKIALGEIPPFLLRMTGLGLGAVLLLAAAAALGRSLAIRRGDIWPIAVAGVLNIAGFNIASAFAQLNTTTSRAAILTFTTPLWSVLFAYLLLGERLDRARLAALGVGAAGLALLAIPLIDGTKSPLGVVFPLVAALAWASGTIFSKLVPLRSDRVVSTGYQLMIGAGVAGLGAVVAGEAMPASLSWPTVGAMSFHIVGSTALAYLLWFVLLDRLSVSAASMTTFAIPVVGVLSAMALVGDRPSLADWIGFAAILTAAGMVLSAVKEEAPKTG